MNPYVIDMIKNNYLEKSDYLEIILNFFSQIKQIPDNKIHKTFILGEAFNWKLSLRHYYSELENLCEIDDYLFIPYEFNQKERDQIKRIMGTKLYSAHLNYFYGIVVENDRLKVPRNTEVLIIDTPAALEDKRLRKYLRKAQSLIMPVVASPIDIRAAERFLDELFSFKGSINNKIKIATIANRVREDTLIAAKLEHYLYNIKLPNGKKLPFMTMLRSSQNYINASERGLSIFELPPSKTYYDREQWAPLLRWLNSKRSIPG